ncbi:hypothetical protein B0H11DRAFT_2207342 [Mycena galericulata]|nr:hypothetical protein B0H11DRAFT_2207342 [Mycena galericulata]
MGAYVSVMNDFPLNQGEVDSYLKFTTEPPASVTANLLGVVAALPIANSSSETTVVLDEDSASNAVGLQPGVLSLGPLLAATIGLTAISEGYLLIPRGDLLRSNKLPLNSQVYVEYLTVSVNNNSTVILLAANQTLTTGGSANSDNRITMQELLVNQFSTIAGPIASTDPAAASIVEDYEAMIQSDDISAFTTNITRNTSNECSSRPLWALKRFRIDLAVGARTKAIQWSEWRIANSLLYAPAFKIDPRPRRVLASKTEKTRDTRWHCLEKEKHSQKWEEPTHLGHSGLLFGVVDNFWWSGISVFEWIHQSTGKFRCTRQTRTGVLNNNHSKPELQVGIQIFQNQPRATPVPQNPGEYTMHRDTGLLNLSRCAHKRQFSLLKYLASGCNLEHLEIVVEEIDEGSRRLDGREDTLNIRVGWSEERNTSVPTVE